MGEASYQKYFNHHDYVGKKILDSSSENSAFYDVTSLEISLFIQSLR